MKISAPSVVKTLLLQSMILTDTHTHQYYEKDPAVLKEKMERCFANGVERLFLPNVDSASIALIDNLVTLYPQHCFAMMGLHPCDVKEGFREELDVLYKAIPGRKIYAVGEIGIDLYWDKSTLEIQQEAFREQIKWAKALNLPIVIHCREAFDEVLEVLLDEQDEQLRGIFHCFSGTVEQAEKVSDLGFYLGIGGVVTYKKSGLDKVVEQIPLEKIVLETDSPYLTPVPYRGKPNESSYLRYVAEKVAEIKQISVEEVARITTENSKLIFNV